MLSSGSQLGPYQIVDQIGAGGMGEVYKATDTRLGRTVAIKILNSDLSQRVELRQRFEREAKTISNLSHPHICSLYDIGRQDGTDFLVMEYLEGETLANRLLHGPLPANQIYSYAIEIADALDKAHRKGIIHRDLKPGNIMLTASGTKLLDFGLARIVDPIVPTADSVAKTLAVVESQDLTTEGTVVGTLNYMAPEQLEGKQTDSRTDIFAFGAVLFEMATGKQAFASSSKASTISAILSKDPPAVSTVRSGLSPSFDHITERCLSKNPDDRWQTMRDLKLELNWISDHPATVASELKTKQSKHPWIVAALFAVAWITVSALYFSKSYFGRQPTSKAQAFQFEILPPKNNVFDGSISVSPDGNSLVYVATSTEGKNMLWLRPMNALDARPLPGTEDAGFPFWSPDGSRIGFFTPIKLKKIDLPTNTVQTIGDAPDARGGTWNQNGIILFAPLNGAGIFKVSETGGAVTEVTSLNEKLKEGSHRYPHFLKDGEHFLFFVVGESASRTGLCLGSLKSRETKFLVRSDSGGVYGPSGYLIYMSSSHLVAQKFNDKEGTISGDPFVISESIWRESWIPGYTAFSIAKTSNVLAYRSGGAHLSQLLPYDRTGKVLAGNFGSAATFGEPALSPDEKTISISRNDKDSYVANIWLIDVVRGTMVRESFGSAFAYVNAVWSPDGKRIAFCTYPDPGIFTQEIGSGKPQLLLKPSAFSPIGGFSPDGQVLVYDTLDLRTNKTDIWKFSMVDRQSSPLIQTQSNESNAQISPNGKWISYISDESGRWEIYIQSFLTPGSKKQISLGGAAEMAFWRKDGKELFYVSADKKMMSVSIDDESGTLQVGIPTVLFQTHIKTRLEARNHYVVSGDGQKFWINTPLQEISTAPIDVLSNWEPQQN